MSDTESKAVTPANDIVIAARGLTKRYGEVNAVDAINFDIVKGEVFGLLGPNGAGKTTTILMMLGLTDISAGQVSVLGHDPARAPLQGQAPGRLSARLRRLLRSSHRGREPVLHRQADGPSVRRNGRGASRRRWRACGCLDVADKRVATFSRGMRQRLGLAEIIVKQAEIAILDEPTSGLDPQATHEFLELIGELKAEGVTVLLSSHLLDQVQRVCDRVALFQAGRIVLMGPVADLARQVLGAGFVVEVEADGTGLARQLATIPGVTNVETLAPIASA